MEGKETKSCCPPGTSCGPSVGSNDKAYCKCGPGWTCVIRKIEEPQTDAKPFYNCSEGCVCITDESKKVEGSGEKQVLETAGAYCYCGEGYACTITKTEGPDAGKAFFECGNGCKCELPASGSEVVVLKRCLKVLKPVL
ncbi:DNA topoisomerase 3-alpha [Bienertia sinuspersici]